MGEAEEIAKAAVYLASDEASFVHRHGDRGRWWGDGSATGRADLSKQFSGSGDL